MLNDKAKRCAVKKTAKSITIFFAGGILFLGFLVLLGYILKYLEQAVPGLIFYGSLIVGGIFLAGAVALISLLVYQEYRNNLEECKTHKKLRPMIFVSPPGNLKGSLFQKENNAPEDEETYH